MRTSASTVCFPRVLIGGLRTFLVDAECSVLLPFETEAAAAFLFLEDRVAIVPPAPRIGRKAIGVCIAERRGPAEGDGVSAVATAWPATSEGAAAGSSPFDFITCFGLLVS